MLCLPEIRLKKICDALFEYLITNLKENMKKKTENLSYLYLLYHKDENDETPSVNYENAKALFLREKDNPRAFCIRPVFDRQRSGLPTIHIVVPQDTEDLRQIGDIEGEQYEEILNEKIERGYQTQFTLVSTSENIQEVLTLNYVLRALLLGATAQLSVVGFINPTFSVQDFSIRQEILPVGAYSKGLIMIATYIESVPEVGKQDGVTKLIFDLDKILY